MRGKVCVCTRVCVYTCVCVHVRTYVHALNVCVGPCFTLCIVCYAHLWCLCSCVGLG